MVCLSRRAGCGNWTEQGHCDIPAMKEFMFYNCYRSCTKCERRDDIPIDGGWSHWSQVAACSVECGGGYKVFYRFCTIPPAMYSGKQCAGPRIKRRRCRTRKCDAQLKQEKGVCQDLNVDCEKKERTDYCDHPVYGSWMKFHCKKTCNVC